METDRKKEVINICLDHFIDKGLSETSTRSLSRALQLQNAGLYYYFATKDEAVIACAEEAARRLEETLITPAIREMKNPDLMMKRLHSRADEMAPTMKFLVSVCSMKQYTKDMRPVLDRLTDRYEHYSELIAKKLNCLKEDVEPYVYMAITAVSNYMVFGEDRYIAPQMKTVKYALWHLMLDDAGSGRKANEI